MKTQTPLTNMENRWVHSTKEVFYALVEMGYDPYIDKYLGYEKLEVVNNGIIFNVSVVNSTSKQAYYHRGHFYDHPYEEFTITEEKVPFLKLEDIEWVMVEAPEWMLLTHIANDMDRIKLGVKITKIPSDLYSYLRKLDEMSKDFKVTWACKEKIDRRLHKNRPLSLAIGRWLLSCSSNSCLININEDVILTGISKSTDGDFIFIIRNCGSTSWRFEITLPDDYIIPDQVLQWMKEYQEQGIK